MNTPLGIPAYNSYELDLPAWFAVPTHNFGDPKHPVWWSLANPTTNSRNLSHRSHQKSIEVKRMGIDRPVVSLNEWDTPPKVMLDTITLEHFDEADKERIHKLQAHPNATFSNHPVLERGRPEKMEKNITYNRHHKHQDKVSKYGQHFLNKVDEVKKGKIIFGDEDSVHPSPSSSRTPSRLSELVSQLSSSAPASTEKMTSSSSGSSKSSMGRYKPKPRGQSSSSGSTTSSANARVFGRTPKPKKKLIIESSSESSSDSGSSSDSDKKSKTSSGSQFQLPVPIAPKKPRGRPAKIKPPTEPKKPRGRPKRQAVLDDFSSSVSSEKPAEPEPKKKAGRPKKYATAEEARTARIEKTKESNKRMKEMREKEQKDMGAEDKNVKGSGLEGEKITKTQHNKIVSRIKKEIKLHKKEQKPVDYLEGALKEISEIKGGATAEQIGMASILRSWIYPRDANFYKDLSDIVHSADRVVPAGNPHIDQDLNMDLNAQAVIDNLLTKVKSFQPRKNRPNFLKGFPEYPPPPPPPPVVVAVAKPAGKPAIKPKPPKKKT